MPHPPSAPSISVVMPYYQNQRTLLRSLRSYVAQTCRPKEIIVVDDGSDVAADAVVAGAAQVLASVPVRVLRAPHGGQSAATNVGIRAATGDVVMLTCPDIVAPPTTLAHHLHEHVAAAARGQEVGVMGHIAYAPWLKMTPFMRFLSKPGPQFCYHLIADAENADPAHLYAPACSVPRARLLAIGGFDEVFTYGYQDTDLGLRLAAGGLRFVYRAKAAVWHDHPNTLANFCARNERVAQLTWHLLDKHPQVMVASGLCGGLRAWGRTAHVLPRLAEEVDALEARLAARRGANQAAVTKVLEMRYDGLLTAAFSRGLLRGGEGMRRRLGIDAGEWRQLCATLLPAAKGGASVAAGAARAAG